MNLDFGGRYRGGSEFFFRKKRKEKEGRHMIDEGERKNSGYHFFEERSIHVLEAFGASEERRSIHVSKRLEAAV